ncbi:MAG TPA: hypothetical protein VFN31_00205 [Candidatus Saccharimonadales bacterium]|nr:hypothetical protein [Candidatus Saccharimonadales bacterium]
MFSLRGPGQYGTQWYFHEGRFFLFPVDDFSQVNERRKKFGLDALKTPVDLSIDKSVIPAKRYANFSDQRPLTQSEFMSQLMLYET